MHTSNADANPRRRNRPLSDKLWDFVSRGADDECWLWRGTGKRYGIIRVLGKRMGAHRASYLLHKGEIPDGLLVMHSCDNPLCVNPKHLSLGTPKENMDDMDRKGRRVVGAARGVASALAKLNDDSVRYIRVHASHGAASLGEQFGVHRKTVEAILIGKTWRHVT